MDTITTREDLLKLGYVLLGDTSDTDSYFVHPETRALCWEIRKAETVWLQHPPVSDTYILDLLQQTERYRLFPAVPLDQALSVEQGMVVHDAAVVRMQRIFPTFTENEE